MVDNKGKKGKKKVQKSQPPPEPLPKPSKPVVSDAKKTVSTPSPSPATLKRPANDNQTTKRVKTKQAFASGDTLEDETLMTTSKMIQKDKGKKVAPKTEDPKKHDDHLLKYKPDQYPGFLESESSDEEVGDARDDDNDEDEVDHKGPILGLEPKVAAKVGSLKKSKKTGQGDEEETESAVMYIGHVPHGFYEKQMKEYFSQFGTVNNLRLARSKTTGRSKGYAFIEFADKDVAEIAVEAMNGYLMFEKILKCEIIPSEQVHEEMFFTSRAKPQKDYEARVYNRPRTSEQYEKRVHSLMKREKQRRAKLAALGVDYSFPGFAQSIGQASSHKKFTDD